MRGLKTWLLLIGALFAVAPCSVLAVSLSRTSALPIDAQKFDPAASESSEFYFSQRLDHFDAQNDATWRQRYFARDEYFDRDNAGPVFLLLGGEWEQMDASVLSSSEHGNDIVEMLSDKRALFVVLEHRYYGKSRPVASLKTAHLKYLSAGQALEDAAVFVAHITAKYGLASTNRWIVFGVSYSGMLAAWFRIKYPHLAFAAISSSAPVQAELNFHQYYDAVGAALKDKSIGGSQLCFDIIKQGHEQINALYTKPGGLNELARKFHIKRGETALEAKISRVIFSGNGVVELPTQTNNTLCAEDLCNYEKICAFLISSNQPTELDKLADLHQRQVSSRPISVSKRDYWRDYLDTEFSDTHASRQWFYQSCTEFGFFQTCMPNTNCPFHAGELDLGFYTDLCRLAFQIEPAATATGIALANLRFGATHIETARIFFLNGGVDPWARLSVQTTDSPDIPTLLLPDLSHHQWTHPLVPNQLASVTFAKKTISAYIDKWLKLSPAPPSTRVLQSTPSTEHRHI